MTRASTGRARQGSSREVALESGEPLSRECIRALTAVQRKLERSYHIEPAPNVSRFVQVLPDVRETVLVQESPGECFLALVLPEGRVIPGTPSDGWLQILEGVSHFVLLTERVRTNLGVTLLELELQAEVDKFVLLAASGVGRGFSPGSLALHTQLFEQVGYLHASQTTVGQRYRFANDLAARFAACLVRRPDPWPDLRRFYRAGQAEKIRLAQAA